MRTLRPPHFAHSWASSQALKRARWPVSGFDSTWPTSTAGETAAPDDSAPASPPGQTALFNSWEDAIECAKCGGRMVRTGSCYTCRDCGQNTGCS